MVSFFSREVFVFLGWSRMRVVFFWVDFFCVVDFSFLGRFEIFFFGCGLGELVRVFLRS